MKTFSDKSEGKVMKRILTFVALALAFICVDSATAQTRGATLSGTITAPSGKALVGAKVSIRNLSTLTPAITETDASGRYTVSDLDPGEYELSVSAEGYSTNTNKITIAAGENRVVDVRVSGVLSLGDLGFSSGQIQGSVEDQARLDKRSRMLKIHQRLGLIDIAPLIATVALGVGAGGKSTSTSDRWAHLALGSVTGDLYFMSAYYAIRAPKIKGTETRGPIRFHKAMAWIHGPGMILTPILGAIAFNQKSNGERVHGIARAHGPVAIITASAYGAAILSVSLKW